MKTKDPQFKNEKWRLSWLAAATVVTVLYLLFLFAVLLPNTSSCSSNDGSFLSRILSCRTPNELGDFLSGAFAPVAFLWLVAAVLIQAQELRAQREELAMTRQELADSREVMKEQAEQARNQAVQAQRQANFIGEQTENLKRQAEDYYREKQDRMFDEMLRALHKSSISRLSNVSCHIQTDGGMNLFSFPNLREFEHERALFQVSQILTHIAEAMKQLAPSAKWPIPEDRFSSILEGLETLISMEDRLSPAGQIKLASLGLKSSRNSISEINRLKNERDSAALHN
jgi:hypothetical protein